MKAKKSPELCAIEFDIENIENQIYDLQVQLQAMLARRDELVLGFAVGDEVEYTKKNFGLGVPRPDVVTRGVISHVAEYWPEMRLFKKDGSLGTKTIKLYDAGRTDGCIKILKRAP